RRGAAAGVAVPGPLGAGHRGVVAVLLPRPQARRGVQGRADRQAQRRGRHRLGRPVPGRTADLAALGRRRADRGRGRRAGPGLSAQRTGPRTAVRGPAITNHSAPTQAMLTPPAFGLKTSRSSSTVMSLPSRTRRWPSTDVTTSAWPSWLKSATATRTLADERGSSPARKSNSFWPSAPR